jgi:uncharacterized protein (TIGR03067 family)
MKRYVMGLIVLAVVAGVVSADDKTEAEVKKLEGAWEIVALVLGSKRIEAPKSGNGGGFVFAKDMKLTLKDPGKPDKPGTYTIDAGANPKQIDLIESKEGNGKPGEKLQGIYEIDGDSLKLALSAEGSKGKRPSTFQGENVMILHLKRQKS